MNIDCLKRKVLGLVDEPWNLPDFLDPYWYFFWILHEYHATANFPTLVDTLSQVDPPSSNGFSSECNGVQTQSGTIESGEDIVLLDLYLNIKCEANPEETISHKNLIVESEGLVWGAIGVSSTHLLESLSGILYVEDDGGMSRDTDNQVAITQAREAIKLVTITLKDNSGLHSIKECKNEHEVELE